MPDKIMLIEDDRSMLALLETLFKLEGFQVVSCGDECYGDLLAKIVQESPGVVLLDVNLSQGSGVELLDAIRSNPALDDVRVIMSSGMELQDQCIKKGAQGFIQKPYMPDDLIKMIKPSETKD